MRRFAVLLSLAFVVGSCSPDQEVTGSTNKMRGRSLPIVQSESARAVCGRMHQVRSWEHNHLLNIVQLERRALSQ